LNYILHLYYTFFQYVQTCMNDCLTLGNIYSYAFLICVIVFVSFELIVVFTGKSSDWVIIIYTKSILLKVCVWRIISWPWRVEMIVSCRVWRAVVCWQCCLDCVVLSKSSNYEALWTTQGHSVNAAITTANKQQQLPMSCCSGWI